MIKLLFKIAKVIKMKFFNPIYIRFYLKFHNVEFDKSSKIYGIPFINNKGIFKIANNVIINSCYENNPIGGNTFSSFWIKKGGEILINEGCRISNSAFVSKKCITIGKNVYIGGDCRFYDTDFHSLYLNERVMKNDPGINSKEIIIEDNVFIGASCIVLKGVKIGLNSVIGAGSILTKNIPANEIWAGVPAIFIKKL